MTIADLGGLVVRSESDAGERRRVRRPCAAGASTARRLRSDSGLSFSVSSLAGGITRNANPCSGYCSIL